MKKCFLSFVLILVLCMSLCGCAADTSETVKDNSSQISTEPPANKGNETVVDEPVSSAKSDSSAVSSAADSTASSTASSTAASTPIAAYEGPTIGYYNPTKRGGCNVEYEVIGYKLKSDEDITYFCEYDYEYMWSRQMIITTIYSQNITQVWTSFLCNSGYQAYGTRPSDNLSGELEDWFSYGRDGELGEVHRLALIYDFDSPVIEDLDTLERYYFKRTSDAWEWTD